VLLDILAFALWLVTRTPAEGQDERGPAQEVQSERAGDPLHKVLGVFLLEAPGPGATLSDQIFDRFKDHPGNQLEDVQ